MPLRIVGQKREAEITVGTGRIEKAELNRDFCQSHN